MRALYTFLLYLATPLFLLRLYIKSWKNPAYAKRIAERFGYFTAPKNPATIWVHAVSLGEVIAATPLIKQLQQRYQNQLITVTTMTPTGSARVQQVFGDSVFHVYVPYDQPGAISRFIARVRPKLAVMMETELWPNLFYGCYRHNIPIIIANARLSARSLEGYRKVAALMKQLLSWVTLVVAQADYDADRYIALGLDPAKVKITGSIKFDMTLPSHLTAQGAMLRDHWGKERPVLIAASTHEGEDERVLQAFKRIKQTLPQAVLILVPRHPERFDKVTALSRAVGFNTVLRTELNNDNGKALEVLIGNTMGEMLLFFAASDVAFVGGSFIPQGGHNVLEPAAVGIPVLTGPHMFNFAEIYQLLQQANGIITVNDEGDLAEKTLELFADSAMRHDYITHAAQVIKQNQGALAKHIDVIDELLEKGNKV